MMREEEEFGRLMAAYRAACPAPDGGAEFMPDIWERIEARQKFSLMLRRVTSAFVTAAATICIAIAIYTSLPAANESPYYTTTYVDSLSQDNTFETFAVTEYATFETASLGGQ